MMRTLALLLFAVRFSSVAAVTTPRPSQADDLTVKLNKRVSSYDIGALSIVGALLRVSNDFRVPMGIVWVDSPSARAERRFAWKDATVQEIIEAIAKTQPGYQVQVSRGVVHLSPPIQDGQTFLKMKIREFNSRNEDIEVASFRLHTLISPRKYGLISVGATGDSRVTLEMKDATVEDILDALAVSSNRKIWIVTFIDNPKPLSTGLRKTGSLFTDQPVPDEEQPTWHFMRWGDPVPPLVQNKTPQASP
jgi:hypothetical protein